MSLSEIIAEIERLDAAAAPAILAAVAALLAKAGDTPPELAAPEPGDVNLSIEQAAAHLHRSTKWIYRHRAKLPFVRKLGPRSYVCSQNALSKWLARRPC